MDRSVAGRPRHCGTFVHDRAGRTFTTGTALRSGPHRRDLYRSRDEEELHELSRGFRKVEAPEPTFPDLLAVALRAPDAIVCCVSSAAARDLTELPPGHHSFG